MSSYNPRYGRNTTSDLDRVTTRVPKKHVREVEQLVDDGEYPNRSEAIRDAIRQMLREYNTGEETQP